MSTPRAEFLLIDIGNTQTKLRLASPERLLGRMRRVTIARLLESSTTGHLRRALAGWRYEQVVLASVVPAAAAILARVLGGSILHVGPRLDIGVELTGYPGLDTLGADRLADLAAAWEMHAPGPLIVADLGTAAVFNAIDADGKFLGGVIAPGLGAMHGNLPDRTAQLPKVRLGKTRTLPRVIGRTTVEALVAGGVYGYRGMVREILAALRAELGKARLVATGGDAHLLAGLMAPDDVIDPDLTMQGLRLIATRNPGKATLSEFRAPTTQRGAMAKKLDLISKHRKSR